MTDRPSDPITQIAAWEAYDSRGRPTVGCAVTLASGALGRVIVPSGASTGAYEAVERRDGGERLAGKGTRDAVANLLTELRPALIGRDATDQADIDQTMVRIDGTPTLQRIGANAVLAVSLAVRTAVLGVRPVPHGEVCRLPLPMFNIISGGAHAAGAVDLQDFLVIPVGASTMAEAVEWGSRVRTATAEIAARQGFGADLVADEGGLGVLLGSNVAALELLSAGIAASGLEPGSEVAIALDVAASQLEVDGRYHLRVEDRVLTADQWGAELEAWAQDHPIVSIEDPFGEDDWQAWSRFTARVGDRIQVVGDDLFATSAERLRRGIDTGAANTVLVKPNQIGTVTATEDLVTLAQTQGIRTVVSARSGDTEDHWLADLAITWGGDQIKVGSLMRSERTAKWNRLLELEADPELHSELRRWTAPGPTESGQ